MERTTALAVMWISMLIFILLLFTVAFYFNYKFKQLRDQTGHKPQPKPGGPMWESSSYTEITKMRSDDDT